ncbi:pentatricopeptide repeat-containing protein At2g37310-like [Zingiber officinale]|uniref:Pentatricopeptide repeat-containing protein n=1 Tax=Zingiber officinale TaxID=94328 RepID=A0A8J5FP39_ZINOF|nr:pentatricopeptide repeat-containing protein At2g37310-like [Zingiber officinale]KAG6492248.1 hypothetical protein ZIOFF_047200 [Zingiber officinale]
MRTTCLAWPSSIRKSFKALTDQIVQWMRSAITGHRVVALAAAPDLRAYGFLLQRWADGGCLREGQKLHARLVALAVVPSNFLASNLISLYSRCGRLQDARRLFDDIPHRNIFSWNAMLLAYALHDHASLAVRLCSSLPASIPPDAFTLSALLKSLTSLPASSHHRSIHALGLRRDLVSDIFVSNGLITSYAHADDLVSARRLFDEMLVRDIVSWNAMLSGYSQSGHYEECLQLYREMEAGPDGVLPNAVTVLSVLQACSRLENLAFGLEVHRFAVEHDVKMDRAGWNSIISFYAKCGCLDYARQVFDEMSDRDGVTYSTLITGYMSYGLVAPAIDLFQKADSPVLSTWNAMIAGLAQNDSHGQVLDFLRRMQASGFRPNAVTLSSVFLTLAFYSNLLGAKQVHGFAIRSDYEQNIYITTALIDTYAKAGSLEAARRVFDATTSRSLIIWTAIISSYAAHGDVEAALHLFNEMLEAGIKPDHVTFTAVLSACAHAGAVDEARRIFDAMLPAYGVPPKMEHYACMVGVLSRGGMIREAAEFIEKMPFEPNCKVWGALLNGATVYGDVALGQLAFAHLLEIEPECTGNYILMANLYSKAGRWEEAKMVRGRMKEIGLEHVPGCSWIETCDGPQSFVAGNTSNTRSAEICAILQGLLGLMREEGYSSFEELEEDY